jgi:hypothetical protein
MIKEALVWFGKKILTNKEARRIAAGLGLKEIQDIPDRLREMLPGDIPVFKDPKTGALYVPDQTGHGGSAWKQVTKQGERVASLDINLKPLRK